MKSKSEFPEQRQMKRTGDVNEEILRDYVLGYNLLLIFF